MLFNSLDFAIFLPIVFFLYWFVFNKNLRVQNSFIVISSYIFYGWWDWRFLSLIIASTALDFFVGKALENEPQEKKRKFLLFVSVGINLGTLIFFKYSNFFIESFIDAFALFGARFSSETLSIILPVGISFYTFQTMSYTIDVYHKRLKATNDFTVFSAYVSFFPQLVAGPIERATNLLPQFLRNRTFDYNNARDGMRQVLWGFFKKIVIADNCAEYVNIIFNNYESQSGSTLVLGAILFSFQIYGDFSGYSDIAIGISKLFGINLMQNFSYPYFSRDIAEFWRRWHISLSTWFRDYLYIPLGGSKGGIKSKIKNTFIIFIVSGFWHGANWTFIIWGILNALYFLPLLLQDKNRNHIKPIVNKYNLPTLKELFLILTTFSLTAFAWIFFRATSLSHALNYIRGITSKSLLSFPNHFDGTLITLLIIFILIEWNGRTNQHPLNFNEKTSKFVRWSVYSIIVFSILIYGSFEKTEFIYFAF